MSNIPGEGSPPTPHQKVWFAHVLRNLAAEGGPSGIPNYYVFSAMVELEQAPEIALRRFPPNLAYLTSFCMVKAMFYDGENVESYGSLLVQRASVPNKTSAERGFRQHARSLMYPISSVGDHNDYATDAPILSGKRQYSFPFDPTNYVPAADQQAATKADLMVTDRRHIALRRPRGFEQPPVGAREMGALITFAETVTEMARFESMAENLSQ